jgi:hypothetical protein
VEKFGLVPVAVFLIFWLAIYIPIAKNKLYYYYYFKKVLESCAFWDFQ